MKRIEKVKEMSTQDFVDFIFELELCDICIECDSVKDCSVCHSLDGARELYKKWLEMEVD